MSKKGKERGDKLSPHILLIFDFENFVSPGLQSMFLLNEFSKVEMERNVFEISQQNS